jgi:transposase-like protein
MDSHLGPSERGKGNKRNGHKTKIVKTSHGPIELKTPQDRQSKFDPQIVKKRQSILAENLEPRILGM